METDASGIGLGTVLQVLVYLLMYPIPQMISVTTLCSGASVASAGMVGAGVVNVNLVNPENSEKVNGVAGTIKSDSVVHVVRSESDECSDVIVCSVEAEAVDPKVIESQEEIRRLQNQDENLVCYVKYLECGSLPLDDQTARKVVLESKNFEIIDDLLHHEDPTCLCRWCLMVPKELQPQQRRLMLAYLLVTFQRGKSTTRSAVFTGETVL